MSAVDIVSDLSGFSEHNFNEMLPKLILAISCAGGFSLLLFQGEPAAAVPIIEHGYEIKWPKLQPLHLANRMYVEQC